VNLIVDLISPEVSCRQTDSTVTVRHYVIETIDTSFDLEGRASQIRPGFTSPQPNHGHSPSIAIFGRG
jgi:hypothetical protein